MKTKMQNLKLSIIIFVPLLLVQLPVHAKCLEQNFEGVFKNRSGDQFKIEQPDCNSLIFTDLQLNKEYKGIFGQENHLSMEMATLIPVGLMKVLPVTFSFDRSHWHQSLADLSESGDYDVTHLDFKMKVYLKQKDLDFGLKSPLIRLRLTLYREAVWYGENSVGYTMSEYQNILKSHLSKPADSIRISLEGIQALSESNDSFAQKAFVRGINLGLSLLADLAKGGMDEVLTRVGNE